MRTSLTQRGETDTLVLTTGACRQGDADPMWQNHVRAGTTLVFYMGVGAANRIAKMLYETGANVDTPVEVASDVSMETERYFVTRLGDLAQVLDENDIRGRALLTVRFPKNQSAAKG